MPPKSTHTDNWVCVKWIQTLFYSSWHFAKKGGDGVNVHWFCDFEWSLDPEVVCDVRLKSQIGSSSSLSSIGSWTVLVLSKLKLWFVSLEKGKQTSRFSSNTMFQDLVYLESFDPSGNIWTFPRVQELVMERFNHVMVPLLEAFTNMLLLVLVRL